MNSETRKAVETAIRMEQDSIDFYSAAAERTANASGKSMYESLVMDEKRHLAALQKILANTGVAVQIEEFLPERGKALNAQIATVFATARQQVEEEVSGDSDDLTALREAIKLENEGFKFYGELAERVDDETAKTVYIKMQSEENEHIDCLTNTLDYMEDSGDWFLWDEQGMLDGG